MIDPFTLLPVAVILLPIGWLWQRQVKMAAKLDDTYSKSETKEMIDLKNKPIQDTLERNTQVSHELAKAIQELKIELAKMNKG